MGVTACSQPSRPTQPCHLQWWGDLRSPPSPRLPLKGPPAPAQVQPGHSEPGKAAEGQPRDTELLSSRLSKPSTAKGASRISSRKKPLFPLRGMLMPAPHSHQQTSSPPPQSSLHWLVCSYSFNQEVMLIKHTHCPTLPERHWNCL